MAGSGKAAVCITRMSRPHFHILLVEDSPNDALLLQLSLQSSIDAEWDILHVEWLHEAIAACGKQTFDAALLDLSLPDSDGLETITDLLSAVPVLPIVVLTGLDDESVALEALKLGAQDYVFKGHINQPILEKSIRYAIERAHNAEQLRQSEERYRQLVDLSPDAIIIVHEQQITFVNEAAVQLLGAITAADLIGSCLSDYICNNQQDCTYWGDRSQSASGGHKLQVEQQWYRKDRVVIDVEVVSAPFMEQKQCARQIVVRDISSRKRAEEVILKSLQQEQELNRLKTSFVSMISHEFRNPLTTIRTFIELFQERSQDLAKEQRQQYFGIIRSAIAQMTQLLEEVLLLGKTDAGGLRYQPDNLNLQKFCQDLVSTLQMHPNVKSTIRFEFHGDRSWVELDGNLLHHILINLLSNAAKYSPQGTDIFLAVTSASSQVSFTVQDQGIGIPPADQVRLFETFHRASNVGSIQGTGLGLAIAKKCVDLHGGQIQVESQVGIGTVITVTLPAQAIEICSS